MRSLLHSPLRLLITLLCMVLLTAFAAGQVLPLLLAGVAAAWLPRLLALRAVGQWVPVVHKWQ